MRGVFSRRFAIAPVAACRQNPRHLSSAAIVNCPVSRPKFHSRRIEIIADPLNLEQFTTRMALLQTIERVFSGWRTAVHGVLLLVFACLPFWPALNGGYILDDDIYVTDNANLRSPEGLYRIWFTMGAEPDYYPLVHSTFWVEYQLWDLNPLGYHFVNVALHAICTVLLWRLLRKLCLPGAWFAAALFAVHPVCVESVAWVTEGKNTLSLFLALLSLLFYLRFKPAAESADESPTTKRRRAYYALSLCTFLAALLAKTVVVALPAVLLVIYWWKQKRISWRTVLPLGPLFLLSILMAALTIWHEKSFEARREPIGRSPFVERMLIAGRAGLVLSRHAGLALRSFRSSIRAGISAGTAVAVSVPGGVGRNVDHSLAGAT